MKTYSFLFYYQGMWYIDQSIKLRLLDLEIYTVEGLRRLLSQTLSYSWQLVIIIIIVYTVSKKTRKIEVSCI